MNGTLRWTYGGRDVAEASFRVDLTGGDAGALTVAFTLNGEPCCQYVVITSRPARFGGRRFYFECPRARRPCEVLCLVSGAFASRQAHRLSYASQTESQLDRLARRAERLRARLWPEDRGRPRGRNLARLEDAWVETSLAFDEVLEAAFPGLLNEESEGSPTTASDPGRSLNRAS
jgi:hypothetical protein